MIYLIRHATAEPANGTPDSQRRLTEEGRREARFAGLALKKLESPITRILSSPFLRAQETAQLMAEALGPGLKVDIRERLASGATPSDILDVVKAEPRDEGIAVVGHNPEIGILTALLVALVPGGTVSFRPGSICCVELARDRDAGRLIWFRTPEDLAALASRD